MTLDPLVEATFTLFLVMLFASASAGKFRALVEFEGVVGNYRLLPAAMVRPAAISLPVAELGVALLLLVPATRGFGGIAAAELFVLFAAAMGINLLRGRREIDCGCFRTAHRQYLTTWHLVRNAVLALFAVALALPAAPRGIGPVDLGLAALGAVALYLVYLGASTVFMPRPPTYDENFSASATSAAETSAPRPFVLPKPEETAS